MTFGSPPGWNDNLPFWASSKAWASAGQIASSSTGPAETIGVKTFPTTDLDCRRAFWFRNPFCRSATLIRRECFERFGNYDEDLKVADDLELWFRFGQGYRFLNVQEPLVKYRVWKRKYDHVSPPAACQDDLGFAIEGNEPIWVCTRLLRTRGTRSNMGYDVAASQVGSIPFLQAIFAHVQLALANKVIVPSNIFMPTGRSGFYDTSLPSEYECLCITCK